MLRFVDGLPTFASGTPFNDLEYTLYDTDYMDGENGGSDVFLPVDPSDPYPGSDRVKYIRCVLNTDLNEVYGSAHADRIILGTSEIPHPFFLRGPDGIDDDYAVIQHFDFEHGCVQLRGAPEDYALLYVTEGDGVRTEGWYLFHIAGDAPDLIAFLFPCDDLEPAVSGNPPKNPNPLCNGDKTLRLDDPRQFVFSQPLPLTAAIPGAIRQYGSPGKEIIGGMTVDAAGNLYLFGCTDGNLDGMTDAANEIFITKFAADGTERWVTELPMAEGTLLKAGTTDAAHLYVCGRTLGALPGFRNAGRWDGILLKIRLSDGQIVAMDQWGNAGIDGYGNIVLDDDGSLFVSAQGSPAGPGGTDDLYLVAKHRTSDLSNTWRVLDPTAGTGFAASAEAWGGLTYQPGVIPGDGRLIVAGWYFSNMGADAFASVYTDLNASTPSRPHSIVIASPGPRADWILDNAVDADGNIYFAGYTTGNLGGSPLGEGDAFIMKFDPALGNLRTVQFGTGKSDMIRNLEIDENGIVYVLGYTYGDYDGHRNADRAQRSGDVFIQRFDSGLQPLQSTQFGTPGEDRGFLCLKDSILYIGGITEGAMVAASEGSFDGYVLALARDDLRVIESPTLAVRDLPHPTAVEIYPNPAKDVLFINTGATGRSPVAYTLLDVLGRTLIEASAASHRIDIRHLPKGMYLLRVDWSGGDPSAFPFVIR
ncbi:MAG: T9SS type A sorting domain-containing protein [Bacteroidetes bacterium]|nr:T9SS type A sorting domain-containing protein [Bacteroidota bacterium]